MRLDKLLVKQFRSIDSAEIDIFDFTSLIGANNAGKSTILRAIELFLNNDTPEISEFRNGNSEVPIVIEGVFTNILDWERSTPGVSALVADNKIELRYTAKYNLDTGKVGTGYEAKVREETIVGWSDKFSEVSEPIKAIAKTVDVDGKGWRTKANLEKVRQKIRETNPELVTLGDVKWSSEGISINAALQQAIPQLIHVPAVRDAADEAKPGTKSAFGLLLKKVIFPALQETDFYRSLLTAVDGVKQAMSGSRDDGVQAVKEISSAISQKLSSIISAKAFLSIESPDIEKIFGNGVTLEIDDGARTPINQQGHGLQRALIFSLLEVFAQQEVILSRIKSAGSDAPPPKQRATILMVEEPELYIHPHLMRKFKKVLKAVSERPEWQVVITTHSPFLVEVADNPQSLVILRKTNPAAPPKIVQLKENPFGQDDDSKREREALRAALDFHPTVCEAFFASRVILVEGDSEQAIFAHNPELFKLFGVPEASHAETTIVSCGGKWTIPAMARIVKAFGIPFGIVHDCDANGRSAEELAKLESYHPYNANARIAAVAGDKNVFICNDCLECLLWEKPKLSQKDKPFRNWKRIREIVAENDATKYGELKKLFDFAYNHGNS